MANCSPSVDCSLNPLKYVEELAKCLFTEVIWSPVKPHIDYWWRFDGNVQGLKDEIERLERENRDTNRKIEEARLRAESATTEIEVWLTEGSRKLEEAKKVSQGFDDDIKMWNIIRRYSVGKSAKETAEGIAKLRVDLNSIPIADPAPPAAMVPICHPPTFEFQSRRGIEEDIMKSLKDGNVRMTAICGTGGVGKTTVVRRIEDRVKKEKLFDEVVFVVFSQQIDMLRIQKEIAEQIRYGLSGDTLPGRAHELRTRLGDPKKKLLIFDDVWARFDPSDIGVPYENGLGGCKVILTSRAQDVCEEMEADKVIEIQVLDKIEAWTLFREKSGDCVDDLALRPIAEDVAAECKGLPIALVTVGRALKNRKIETWRDALSQLRGANPTNFPQVLKDVYMPLKLSYDFLERSEKDLFLLCCLYPEDYDIPIEELALSSFGLGLFEGINSIEDGRNRTHHLIERLRSRFLLMTGGTDDEVKMHDVIRDVAIFIGSKEKHVVLRSLGVDMSSKDSSRNCNWLSLAVSKASANLQVELDFPNLRLLMILRSVYFKSDIFSEGMKQLITSGNFSEGMKELTVLYLSNQNLTSFPQIMRFLKKLRMLHLVNCNVSDISVVGELASLEILRVLSCDQIKELPADVGKLKFLRSLELQRCRKLTRIVAGVVSSLVGLEELKIVGCFIKWGAKGNLSEERNASLSELESLHNLTSLEIDTRDANLVAEEIRLPQLLKRFHISFFNQRETFDHERKYERTIKLRLWSDVTVGNWIRQLVKSTQSLTIVGEGSTVKRLVNVFNWKFLPLEHLELRQLWELEEIIDGTIPEESPTIGRLPMLGYSWESLTYLKSMVISHCPNLRYIFPMAVLRSLVQLERLEIDSCRTIEQVFWNEMESKTCIIEFPTLKLLILRNLPSLAAFTQGDGIIKSPQLKLLIIKVCPKLRTKIGIEVSCRCMIEKLDISHCDTIEEIFWNEIEDDGGNRHITFPELDALHLIDLPCLTTFCRGVETIKFPKMKVLYIKNLSRMKSLLPIDSEPTHDPHCFPYFCSQKVEMVGLKELYLVDLPDEISKIWCHHIRINFFHNLEVLEIYRVNGIRNLLSSSIAKALVNLKRLRIEDCNEIVDVIENEAHVPVHCVFPNLKYLTIFYNYKLRSFCQWTHAFELPSLEEVTIVGCPMMKTFTIGSLTSPKLRELRINDREIGMNFWNYGINHFITEMANQDENKDESSNETEDSGEGE